MTPAGFPHSDTSGSKSARDSPEIFAACHVLLRLLAPRHPLRALCSLTPPAPDQVVSRGGVSGLILDKTRRNRSSSITAETRIPVGKVRSTEMDPEGEPEGSLSSDPLVGDLSLASRGHGSGDRGPDTKRRLEGRPPSRRARQRVDLEQSPRGLTRALQF